MSGPAELTESLLRAWPLPQPGEGGDKDSRGRVLIVGGPREVPGAVLLAARAALRAGAGKLQLAVAETVAPLLAVRMPEARVVGAPEADGGALDGEGGDRLLACAPRCDALLIGPGLSDGADTAALTRRLLAEAPDAAAVLDAGALCGADALRAVLEGREGRAVLTPHAGEMASVLDRPKKEVEADPFAVAREAAASLNAVVALKGAATHVAAPDGRVWVNRRGGVGLGVSGSGDTLAGIAAALLARGAEPAQAACFAVFAHAVAGERLAERIGPLGFLARELPDEIPAVLAGLARDAR